MEKCHSAGVYIQMWVRLSPPSGSITKIGLGRKTIFNIQRKEQTTEHGFFCLF